MKYWAAGFCVVLSSILSLLVSAPATARIVSGSTYIAIGDSFSAQDGNAVYNTWPCERAPDAYPSLVGSALDVTTTSEACTGADSANLLSLTQPGATSPQLKQVGPFTQFVTMLIGINDLGTAPFRFVGELYGCQLGNSTAQSPSSCQSQPGMNSSSLSKAVKTFKKTLAKALKWMHSNAHSTKVFVLDYPSILGTSACTENEFLTTADLTLYRTVLADLNQAIEVDAVNAKDPFVDLFTPSVDANGCPDWTAPVTTTGSFANHPTEAGEAAMAEVVEQAIVPPTAPGAPGDVVATPGDQSATVSWTAADANRSPVTSYTVSAVDSTTPTNGGQTETTTGDQATITGLTDGDAYTFAVSATNGVGTGPVTISAPVTPAGVPDPPTDVVATPDAASDPGVLVVSFDPAFDEGSNVSGYTVTITDLSNASDPNDGATVEGSASPITVTGLTSGDTYSFVVSATNEVGTGAPSVASAGAPSP